MSHELRIQLKIKNNFCWCMDEEYIEYNFLCEVSLRPRRLMYFENDQGHKSYLSHSDFH